MKHLLLITLTTLSLAACQTMQTTQTNPNSRTGVGTVATEPAPAALSDVWALRQLNGNVIDKANFPRRVPYLDVNLRDTYVIGSTGCNQFTGKFEATGKTLKIGPLRVTKMACANGMSVENEFITALESADSYQLDGKNLTLFRGTTALMTLGKGD